ncbi:hypothetical protein [Martelella radicis]|uniref:Uncharacterized protein n=1 Tax=Martelella radicis TaxID=1397476 RepID=A0A7W6KHB5_9HYPH|nr:hypothetical protein [Martelella radicis]MBB4121093.1 hypothetical protein [Martelella radicis]
MLDGDVGSFIGGYVMMIAATRDERLRPHVGRGCGARFDKAAGDVVFYASSTQWPDFARCAVKGAPIAATFVDPETYRAYQIKGRINAVRPSDPSECAKARRYIEEMLVIMAELGVSRLQLSSVFADDSLITIRFWPADLFLQTPGPGAGQPIEAGAGR